MKEENSTTVLLIRHGENDWTKNHRLAGRLPGVHLNERGQQQAKSLGWRLVNSKINAIYASPLERTVETAQAIAEHHGLEIQINPNLIETDFGQYTGKFLNELTEEKSWQMLQSYPSQVRFPDGESIYEMQARMVQAINQVVLRHPAETIVLVSHADPIKVAVSHYLGLHLDLFQRIIISTASMTTLNFTPSAIHILAVNDTAHEVI